MEKILSVGGIGGTMYRDGAQVDNVLALVVVTGEGRIVSCSPHEQRGLFEAGLLSEIKPPLRDLTRYRDRKAIPIQGERLSETVIRERR